MSTNTNTNTPSAGATVAKQPPLLIARKTVAEGQAVATRRLAALPADYAVDCSGSTQGTIMGYQLRSFQCMTSHWPVQRVIAWGSGATTILPPAPNTESARLQLAGYSGGGTSPQSIVPCLSRPLRGLVLYTDGQVSTGDMESFQRAMEPVLERGTPVLVIFSLSPSDAAGTDLIQQLRNINMSVPNACTVLSDHVCLVMTRDGTTHRVLMSSGSFARVFPAPTLTPSTRVADLPVFDPARLADVIVDGSVPPGHVILPGYPDHYVSLDAVYTGDASVPIDVFETLCQGAYLRRIDTKRMHGAVSLRMRTLTDNPRVAQLSESLARIAVDPQRAGGEEHRALLEQWKDAKRASSVDTAGHLRSQRNRLQQLLNVLTDFATDKTSFVLGSNRANRATHIDDAWFDDPAAWTSPSSSSAVTVVSVECPIFLDTEVGCVLLTVPPCRGRFGGDVEATPSVSAAGSTVAAPPSGKGAGGGNDAVENSDDDEEEDDDDNNNNASTEPTRVPAANTVPTRAEVLQWCTDDYAMENPFELGARLRGAVTRGVFGFSFASQCTRSNPYTSQPVLGYVPLVSDPTVVMRYVSRAFGDSREMWHLLRAYIALLVNHIAEDAWAEQEPLRAHLQALLNTYHCTLNLKGSTDERRPLRECLRYVTTNYETCLRDRTPGDIRQIVRIVDTLIPEHVYGKHRIEAMATYMEEFARLLRWHKQSAQTPTSTCGGSSGRMFRTTFQVDPVYGHIQSDTCTTVRALIARLLWYDEAVGKGVYRRMRLQEAVNTSLTDRRFGPLLRRAFIGDPFDGEAAVGADTHVLRFLPTAATFPVDVATDAHFGGVEYYGTWTRDGRTCDQCVYCGADFRGQPTNAALRQHVQKALGPYYCNAQQAARTAVNVLGVGTDDLVLFRDAKQRLLQAYGPYHVAQHTVHITKMLLYFIRRYKKVMWECSAQTATAQALSHSATATPSTTTVAPTAAPN